MSDLQTDHRGQRHYYIMKDTRTSRLCDRTTSLARKMLGKSGIREVTHQVHWEQRSNLRSVSSKAYTSNPVPRAPSRHQLVGWTATVL